MPTQSTFKINKGFITQKLDDKTVIFDGEESVLYTFNESASYLFSRIKKGLDKDQLVSSLVKRYGVNKKKAFNDVNNLLTDLLKKKIITHKTVKIT